MQIISIIMLIAGLLLLYFAEGVPLTILGIVLAVVGAILAKLSRRR